MSFRTRVLLVLMRKIMENYALIMHEDSAAVVVVDDDVAG